MTVATFSFVSASSPCKGSSMIKISYSARSALAIATRRFMPPLYSLTGFPAISSSSIFFKKPVISSFVFPVVIWMLVTASRFSNRRFSWNIALIFWCSIPETVPSSAFSSPIRIDSSVDFPIPDFPIIQVIFFSRNVQEKWSNTWLRSYVLHKFFTMISIFSLLPIPFLFSTAFFCFAHMRKPQIILHSADAPAMTTATEKFFQKAHSLQ